MMKGYDREEALALMRRRINRREHAELAERIDSLLAQAIDADMAYMHEAGVLDEEGDTGEGDYEDDDAIEFIVERLAAQNDLTPEQAVKVAALVDDFMDLQLEYMAWKGLVAFE